MPDKEGPAAHQNRLVGKQVEMVHASGKEET